jgi:hypothetical protein
MIRERLTAFGLALALALAVQASGAAASEPGAEVDAERLEWQKKKCAVFEAAFGDLVKGLGTEGTSEAFLAGNRAYIESGCLADVDACPETEKDIDIANGLTIATMNAGAASTFSPFRCRG